MSKKEEYIKSLDVGERDVFAEMIMRSLRGSWNMPMPRTLILETIADVGGLLVYDEEELKGRVESYKKKMDWDGRHFRPYYGKVDISEVTTEDKVKEMASNIPYDMTWDDWRIEKEFEEEEA